MNRQGQLQLLQHQVASAALSGLKVDEIDRELIAPSDCSEDGKAALRLYAFSFLPRFDQRRIAFDQLYAVGHEEAGSPACPRALPPFPRPASAGRPSTRRGGR